MSEEEQIKILASDGMLVKRPILVSDNFERTARHMAIFQAEPFIDKYRRKI